LLIGIATGWAAKARSLDAWRDAAGSARPKLTDDAKLATVLPTAIYAWCINRA